MQGKIQGLLEGWLMYFLFRMGLVTDPDVLSQIKHRREKCFGCPLKSGNWCSKNKSIIKVIYQKKRFGSIKSKNESITGCGCYLPAKYFASFYKVQCPLNKWSK